jgi:hypothetical protein
MRKVLVALLIAPFSVAATVSMTDDGYPPVNYQGDATATVQFVNQDQIDSLCGKAPKGFQTEACQTGPKIILPNPCSAEFKGEVYARLSCHELGHLNGWPSNHPRP